MARQQREAYKLLDIKNNFYIGNYQQCINEAQNLREPSSPEVAIERDIFTYRAYIAQNKFLVCLDEIRETSHERIAPLKMLAEYFQNKSQQRREEIVAQIDSLIAGNVSVDNDTLILVAATVYSNEGNYEAAYRVLHSCESLEAQAMILDILLKINRVDLAKKKLKEMQDKDDDAILTQLAQAWVNVAPTVEKYREAYCIYFEMIDKYGATPLLLNGQAAAQIAQAKYKEAGVKLQEALYMDPNYPDTLVNLIVLNRQQQLFELGNKYFCQLKDAHPDHPYIVDVKAKEAEFDRACSRYTFKVYNA